PGGIGAAGAIAALIRTARCVHERHLPGTPSWIGPADPDLWRGTSWYVPSDSRPWFLEEGEPRRIAAISALDDAEAAHIVLSEVAAAREACSPELPALRPHLIPVVVPDEASLLKRLSLLQRDVAAGVSVPDMARREMARFSALPKGHSSGARPPLVVALVASDADELLQELDLAHRGVTRAIAQNAEWTTPRGSCFAAAPLGPRGGVAFVYPGGISAYP